MFDKVCLISAAWFIMSYMPPASLSAFSVIAHRGNSSESPENTLASFLQAIELGVEYIECDIHLTKDKVPVVVHDHILERTTDNNKPLLINEITAEELSRLDAGSWYDQSFAGQSIPTLEQVLKLPFGTTGLMIEIKDESSGEYEIAEAVAQILLKTPSMPPIIIGSFNPAILAFVRKLIPQVPIIAIVEDLNLLAWHNSNRPDLYAFDKDIVTKNLIQAAHSGNKSVWAWTIDDDKKMEELAEWGIDGVITNYPRAALLIRPRSQIKETVWTK
jgi:glycerophosphoryl diester phosphodiesterase